MASLMDQLDQLTRRSWVQSNPVLLRKMSQLARLLFSKAKRDQPLGAKIEFGLRTSRPPVKRLAFALDTFPDTGGPSHVKGVLDWGQYAGGLQITGTEIRAQHGVNIQTLLKKNSLAEMSENERVILMSVLNGQISEGIESMGEFIGDEIFNNTGTGGGIVGLQAIIDNSQTNYAGLAYNDSAFATDTKAGSTTYWEPQVSTNSGTLRDVTMELLQTTLTRCRRGGERPESVVVVSDNDLWGELELMLQGSKTYRDDTTLAQIGYDAFEWRHSTFMPDERAPANKFYVLNLNHLYLQVRPSADENNFVGWSLTQKQDAAYGPILTELQLVCNDRHRQGLVGDVKGNSD